MSLVMGHSKRYLTPQSFINCTFYSGMQQHLTLLKSLLIYHPSFALQPSPVYIHSSIVNSPNLVSAGHNAPGSTQWPLSSAWWALSVWARWHTSCPATSRPSSAVSSLPSSPVRPYFLCPKSSPASTRPRCTLTAVKVSFALSSAPIGTASATRTQRGPPPTLPALNWSPVRTFALTQRRRPTRPYTR